VPTSSIRVSAVSTSSANRDLVPITELNVARISSFVRGMDGAFRNVECTQVGSRGDWRMPLLGTSLVLLFVFVCDRAWRGFVGPLDAWGSPMTYVSISSAKAPPPFLGHLHFVVGSEAPSNETVPKAIGTSDQVKAFLQSTYRIGLDAALDLTGWSIYINAVTPRVQIQCSSSSSSGEPNRCVQTSVNVCNSRRRLIIGVYPSYWHDATIGTHVANSC
jgi:hypothetical protein